MIKTKHNLIIGIKGKRRTGKNTVAEILMEYFWHRFKSNKIYSASDIIIDAFVKYTGGNRETIIANKEILRPLFQVWGDLYRATFISQIKDLMDHMEEPYLFIVPSIRLLSEAKAIKAWGGVIIGVSRNPPEQQLDLKIDLHQTEWEVDKITPDIPVNNDGSLESLRKNGMCKVIEWLDKLISKE